MLSLTRTALLGTTSWAGIVFSTVTFTFIPSIRDRLPGMLALTEICPFLSTTGLMPVICPTYVFDASAKGITLTFSPFEMNGYSDSMTVKSTSILLSSSNVQRASAGAWSYRLTLRSATVPLNGDFRIVQDKSYFARSSALTALPYPDLTLAISSISAGTDVVSFAVYP